MCTCSRPHYDTHDHGLQRGRCPVHSAPARTCGPRYISLKKINDQNTQFLPQVTTHSQRFQPHHQSEKGSKTYRQVMLVRVRGPLLYPTFSSSWLSLPFIAKERLFLKCKVFLLDISLFFFKYKTLHDSESVSFLAPLLVHRGPPL